MTGLGNVLRQLREERDQAHSQVQKLQSAISTIEALVPRGNLNAINSSRPKRTMSAAARRRIAQAQRARWAKLRKTKPAVTARTPGATAAKRTLSPEGRKRIVAAARARWARARAEQRKKGA
jgi:hypothetical protein